MKSFRFLRASSALSLAFVGLAWSTAASQAQAQVMGQVSCGGVITTNTTLTADVGPCSTTAGIVIGADNVTLNLNGHKVSGIGAGQGTTQGIVGSGVSGATVENGTVTGFDTGVYFEFGSGETITKMNAHDNIGSLDGNGIFGEGIQLFQVTNSTISNNQVIHNGTFAGIDVFDASGITITGNVVTDNNILESMSTHGGGNGIMQDIGIWVVFLSLPTTSNVVSTNSVTGSGLDGIQISRFANGNTVTRNSALRNGFGQVQGVRDGAGVIIFGADNLVQANGAIKNAAQGIEVLGKSNRILNNAATGNGTGRNSAAVAFDVADANFTPPCDSNVWSHNAFITANQACVTH